MKCIKEAEKRRFMKEKENYYAYWLYSLPGIGVKTIDRLLRICQSPSEIYAASDELLKQALGEKQLLSLREVKSVWRLQEEYEELKKRKLGFVWRGSGEYPERLYHIPDAPFALFYKGRLPENHSPSVAIVGARDCSRYGSYVAQELGRYLGEQGVSVISGMARGIDGISQEAALKAGGISYGVLGCGADICYPPSNRRLYEELIEKGGILSAYLPGTPPLSQNFPPRNRIVSGLADAVVVIEARSRSGTLITVDMALEQGKEVYVVPGRVTDRLSDGCNRLLKQGAGVFLSPQDFVEELRELKERQKGNKNPDVEKCGKAVATKEQENQLRKARALLSEELQSVYMFLNFEPQSIEEISSLLPKPLSASEVSVILMRLCMEGYAVQVYPGCFCIGNRDSS